MGDVIVSTRPVPPPEVEETLVAADLQGVTFSRMVNSLLHLAGYRTLRCGHTTVDYDTSSSPIIEQSPNGVNMATRKHWTISSRARFVWISARVQAAPATGGCEVVARLLRASDDLEIDPGVKWLNDVLLRVPLQRDGGLTIYPIQRLFTGFGTDIARSALSSRTTMLNVNGYQGTFAAVEVSTTNARILSVDVGEIEDPSFIVPQVFAA